MRELARTPLLSDILTNTFAHLRYNVVDTLFDSGVVCAPKLRRYEDFLAGYTRVSNGIGHRLAITIAVC